MTLIEDELLTGVEALLEFIEVNGNKDFIYLGGLGEFIPANSDKLEEGVSFGVSGISAKSSFIYSEFAISSPA